MSLHPAQDTRDVVSLTLRGIVDGPGPIRGVVIGPLRNVGFASAQVDAAAPMHLVLAALALVRQAERAIARQGEVRHHLRAPLAVARYALDQALEDSR